MKYWCYKYDPSKESFSYSEHDSDDILTSNQVRIKPIIVGVCGSDLKQILSKEESPTIGHEWVGLIEEIGSRVTAFKAKEKVVSVAHISCGACQHCLQSDFNHCTNRQLLGGNKKSVLSSSIILEQEDLLKVPQDLSFQDLALFEVAFIGDSAYAKAKSIGLRSNDQCLVFGAGPIGIFTALALKLRGHDVTIIEVQKDRLEAARELGLKAIHFTKALINTNLHNLYDAVFDCSGDNHGKGALQALPAFPKINGIVVIVGKYSDGRLSETHYSGKSLRVTWVANHEKSIFENTIQFWKSHIFDYSSKLSRIYDIKDINTAFNDAIHAKNIKNLIQVNSDENS